MTQVLPEEGSPGGGELLRTSSWAEGLAYHETEAHRPCPCGSRSDSPGTESARLRLEGLPNGDANLLARGPGLPSDALEGMPLYAERTSQSGTLTGLWEG